MNCLTICNQLEEFNKIIKETDATYSRLAKRSGLSDCSFWIMYSIRETDRHITQRELCEHWTMSKQTINSALKVLESKGYITLNYSDEDKRSKYIILTEKGEEFARENVDIVFEMEKMVFEKLSEQERAFMLSASRKFQKLLLIEVEKL